MSPPMIPLEDRFVTRTKKNINGCILWTALKDIDGYGLIKLPHRNGKQVRAHRLSYELFIGPIPDGLYVLHRCDTPSCVNPVHLFVGTNQDNVDDKVKKGRGNCSKGTSHYLAKLTDDDVAEIRRRRAAGELLTTIAADFGIPFQNVSRIYLRKIWRHVP